MQRQNENITRYKQVPLYLCKYPHTKSPSNLTKVTLAERTRPRPCPHTYACTYQDFFGISPLAFFSIHIHASPTCISDGHSHVKWWKTGVGIATTRVTPVKFCWICTLPLWYEPSSAVRLMKCWTTCHSAQDPHGHIIISSSKGA